MQEWITQPSRAQIKKNNCKKKKDKVINKDLLNIHGIVTHVLPQLQEQP